MSDQELFTFPSIARKRTAEEASLVYAPKKVLRYAKVSKAASSFDPKRPIYLDAQCNAYIVMASISTFGETPYSDEEDSEDEPHTSDEDLYLRERDIHGFLEYRAGKLASREDRTTHKYLDSTGLYLSQIFAKFSLYRGADIPIQYKRCYDTTLRYAHLLEEGFDKLMRLLLDPDNVFERYTSEKEIEGISTGGKAPRKRRKEFSMDGEFVEFLSKQIPRIRRIASTLRYYSARKFPSMGDDEKEKIIYSCYKVEEGFNELYMMLEKTIFLPRGTLVCR